MPKRTKPQLPPPAQLYTDEQMSDVIAHVANGGCISTGNNPHGISHMAFYKWLEKNEDKRAEYIRARELWAIHHAEHCLAIADNTAQDTLTDPKGGERANHEWISRSKLRVDCRIGLAKMFARRLFGDDKDKQEAATVVNPGITITTADAGS